MFKDDNDALRVIQMKARGRTASEIRRELGMSEKDHDTVTKRIRRRFAKSSRMPEIDDE